ncbi:VanZ family protein [Leucobacter zeae]|nr:VanZ family protein [Leucobacter zeae]
MSNPFDEIPVLPVAIPFGLVVFALLLWRLTASRRFSVARAAVAGAVAVYAAGILANTVFPIYRNPPAREESWVPGVVLVPFADYEIADALMNVLVFVPIGILVPLLLARPSWGRALAAVAATSLAIELTQLAVQLPLGGGHIADVSDFICNTAGGMLGYGVFVLLARVPVLARLVDRFRWSEAVPTA